MTDNRLCPNCGAQLPQDSKEGLCPQCLMKLALGEGDPEESSTSSTTELTSPPHDWVNPEQIGPYRILETLGEGGMGVVYLAEQREPIRRRVALKVIKLGMDTREVIARFESERQALALMNHPNIAKVLDAGATEEGRPYFVMEYVKGISITEYCDRNRLSTKQRLELFIPACQAIQHAHQKGIIHRDIKPSNVLVELQDNVPVPRIIDFGLAKATNQRLTEKTFFTQHGVLLGTPAYMSPEQAEFGALDVDTTTDIYSLGVLLYELLVGAPPFDDETLRNAGYVEMVRVIQEEDPPTLSSRLDSLGHTASEVARRRHTDLSRLSKELTGDLDWITLKALEKDRTRRYPSASGLGEDIRRHLDDEPVTACPPSWAYRVHKFIKRYRTFVAAASTVFVVLFAAAIVSTLLYFRAQSATKRAEYGRYVAAIRAADRSLAEGEAGEAKRLLQGCAENLPIHRKSSKTPART